MEQKKIPDLSSEKIFCCGCAACYSVCPTQAITMKADEKGFWYPQIDGDKCICCRRCLQVCAFKRDIL